MCYLGVSWFNQAGRIFVVGHLHKCGPVVARLEDGRLPHRQFTQKLLLGITHEHGGGNGLAVCPVAQLVGNLQVRVAHGVGREFFWALVGNEYALAVGTHFGQHRRKRFHSLGPGVGGYFRGAHRADIFHDVVSFFDHG